jgi:hypothetical protein
MFLHMRARLLSTRGYPNHHRDDRDRLAHGIRFDPGQRAWRERVPAIIAATR